MTTTVIVAATRAWLTDPLDPGGASVQCGTRRDGPLADVQDGELLVFAGNRSELVTYDTGSVTLPLTFAFLTPAQYAQVLLWRGRTLLLRTIDGLRYFGGYLSINQGAFYRGGGDGTAPFYDAGVTFLGTTYTDTV
jgi:hypothetical protein